VSSWYRGKWYGLVATYAADGQSHADSWGSPKVRDPEEMASFLCNFTSKLCHFNKLLNETCSSQLLLGRQHLWPSIKYVTIKLANVLNFSAITAHYYWRSSKYQTITQMFKQLFLISIVIKAWLSGCSLVMKEATKVNMVDVFPIQEWI
jgi:hypothetical protein